MRPTFTFEAIAILRSCFAERFGTPRQGRLAPSSRGTIEFLGPYAAPEFCQGLETFSHLWLLSVFHTNTNRVTPGKAKAPRLAGGKIGTLASRSPHRPNPIALSCCRIVRVKPPHIEVAGVDLIEGTPILDIKPYVPCFDAVPEASAGWLEQQPLIEVPVRFAESYYRDLQNLPEPPQLENLIRECLRHDPRPLPYKKLAPRRHVFTLYAWDISYRWSAGELVVEAIGGASSRPRRRQ